MYPKPSSALLKMGYQIEDLQHGVYLLKRFHGPQGRLNFFGAGIFYSPVPLSETDTVYLYEFDAMPFRDDPEAVHRLLRSLADLNVAHLVDDPANQPLPVPFAPDVFGGIVENQTTVPRAEPGQQRPVGLTESGDVICYR